MEEKSWRHVTRDDLASSLTSFTGSYQQTPPLYSALHIDGRRLYQLAREGVPVDLEAKARPVTIFEMNLLAFAPPMFTIELRCSKGTYIRSLVRDLAESLGTVAHLSSLVRTHQGPFVLDMALREEEWCPQRIRAAVEASSSLLRLESERT